MECKNNTNDIYIQKVCVGYAFLLPQIMSNTYEPNEALANGTMFPELNMPFGTYVPKNNEEKGACEND